MVRKWMFLGLIGCLWMCGCGDETDDDGTGGGTTSVPSTSPTGCPYDLKGTSWVGTFSGHDLDLSFGSEGKAKFKFYAKNASAKYVDSTFNYFCKDSSTISGSFNAGSGTGTLSYSVSGDRLTLKGNLSIYYPTVETKNKYDLVSGSKTFSRIGGGSGSGGSTTTNALHGKWQANTGGSCSEKTLYFAEEGGFAMWQNIKVYGNYGNYYCYPESESFIQSVSGNTIRINGQVVSYSVSGNALTLSGNLSFSGKSFVSGNATYKKVY